MNEDLKYYKFTAALRLDRLSVVQMIADANHYVLQMKGNVYFPSPNPSLNKISDQVQILQQAYLHAQTRVIGSKAEMDQERGKLHVLLTSLASYVETIANDNPERAKEIFQSTGMPTKVVSIPPRSVFRVQHGPYKGEVVLRTKALPGTVIIYQMSTDPENQASWKNIYAATKVKYTVKGLTPGLVYYFRFASTPYGIQSDWSQVISILVL